MAKTHRKIDQERIQKAVREILLAIGEDVDREGLLATPERVGRMYAELLGGMYATSRASSPKSMTKSSCSVTFRSIVSASTICCPSSVEPMSRIYPRAKCSVLASWHDWWIASHIDCRHRSD